MAKMFYTLEEAAEKLGLSEDELKDMAGSGKLQQFRDRDKLMFKREQVDNLAKNQGTAAVDAEDSNAPIPLSGSGDTDAIDLREDEPKGGTDKRDATGISVFDAGEVEPVDPAAQTQVTQPRVDDEDLALETVGSGSGLLDLTRESDDTSLGAELLDEIYPGGEPGDSKAGSAVGSSGVFESAIAMETGQSAPSGLEHLQGGEPVGVTGGAAPSMAAAYDAEPSDPAGNGLAAGLLLGTTIALILGLIVAVAGVADVNSGLAATMTQSTSSMLIWCGGLLVLAIVFGVVGMVIGKAVGR